MAKVSSTASCRLRADYLRIKRDPVPYITAEPLPSNILEWHYVVEGPAESPYAGGFYHGRLCFPTEYPFRPPSIYMNTPSGRFKTNTRLCLSISDFHPDTWNPSWCVSTILTGLLSFMLEKAPTYGSIESSDSEKQAYAIKSWQYNLDNRLFCELFPDIVEKINGKVQKRQEELAALKNRMSRSLNGQISDDGCNGSISSDGTRRDTGSSMALLTNVAVVTGFAVFAWLVRCILVGLTEET